MDERGLGGNLVSGIYHSNVSWFIYVLVASEIVFSFVVESCRIFLHHGLANFIVNVGDDDVLQTTIYAMFVACLLLPIVGIVIDSYLGQPLVALCLFPLVLTLPALYFTISMPWLVMNQISKMNIYSLTQALQGVLFLFEPVRLVVISTSVLENQLRTQVRYFYGAMLSSYHIGMAFAALAIYLCRSSRMAYTCLMILNSILISAYFVFWILEFVPTNVLKKDNFCIVEKVLLNIICYACKKLDQISLQTTFSRSQGWRNFEYFSFSPTTAESAKAFWRVTYIIIPLTALFFMKVVLKIVNYTQYTMLSYNVEQYPIEGLKATFFLILFLPFEFFVFSRDRRFFKKEISLQLITIGVGAFILSLCLAWTAFVQNQIVVTMLQGRASFIGHAQLTFINCLSERISIHVDPPEILHSYGTQRWFSIDPMSPWSVLQVPTDLSPLQLSVKNYNFSMYDEYELDFDERPATWYVLHQDGVMKLPPSAFPPSFKVSMNPKLFHPAKVSIFCLIPICRGYLKFETPKHHEINVLLEDSKKLVTKEMVGQYQIMFAELGNSSGQMSVEETFHPLSSYLILIYEHFAASFSHNNVNATLSSRSTIKVMETIGPRRLSVLYMYPLALLYALGEVIALVSFWSWLFTYSPPTIRATLFCISQFLSIPALAYFNFMTPTIMQRQKPLTIFTAGCITSFCLVLYLVAAHKFHETYSQEPLGPEVLSNEDMSGQGAQSTAREVDLVSSEDSKKIKTS